MIHFLHTRGHDFELKEVVRSPLSPRARQMDYDTAFKHRRLPGSTYVFTDLERLGYWDLELAANLFLQLQHFGQKVLNNPARVKNRYEFLRAMHAAGLNDFNVYRAAELPAHIRFPAFVRKWHGHAKPLSGLLQTREEIDQAIEAAISNGIPAENQIVVEYVGEPVVEGLFRKLAAFRVGEKIVPYIGGHDTHWHVKEGKTGIATEDLYREELEIIRKNPHAEHLRKAFDIADIQFGRADYGFYRGRLQVFEINTNPLLEEFSPHPSPFRVESMKCVWENILGALHELDSAAGRRVKLPGGKLARYQKRNLENWFTRSRRTE